MKIELKKAKRLIPANIKKPTFDDFEIFNKRFSIIYEFLIRITIIVVLITLFFYFMKEITSKKYVLTNIEVARSVESKNIYAGDLKQKIIIDMKNIMGNAKNATHTSSSITNTVSNDAIPLNIGGFDLNQIFVNLRRFFQMRNREIKAYLMSGGKNEEFKLVLNIGNEPQIEKSLKNEIEVTQFLAEKILFYNTPHKMGLFYIEEQDSVQVKEIIKHLDEQAINENWLSKLFNGNHWEDKKNHIEAMNYYSNKKYKEALVEYKKIKDIYPEIKLEIANTKTKIFADTATKKVEQDKLFMAVENICNLYSDTSKSSIKRLLKADYLDDEDALLKSKALVSRANMILSDIHSQKAKYEDSDKLLNLAIKSLSEEDFESNSDIYNWAANIKMRQLNDSTLKNSEYTAIKELAVEYCKKAIELKNDGNYFDTLAEIKLRECNLKDFYKNINLALKYPNKAKDITKEDYKIDKRWSYYINSVEFQAVLNQD